MSDPVNVREAGEEIVIARRGMPIARLVPFRARRAPRELGLYLGQIRIAADFNAPDEAIDRAFKGDV